MDTKRLIGEGWDDYRRMVVPEGASEAQVNQTRKAYYAGAITVMEVAKRVAEPDISEDRGMELFASMDTELKAFMSGLLSEGGN